MSISMIVAIDKNNGIGKDNHMPWYIPADLKRFREITMGKAIIMGRNTHQSIGGNLDGRVNIVLSRKNNPEGSVGLILDMAKNTEVFVIGGAEIYEQLMPYTDKLYVTLINADYECDKFFPLIDTEHDWEIVSFESIEDANPVYSFLVYERKTKS